MLNPILRKGRFRLAGRQKLAAAHLGLDEAPGGDDTLADELQQIDQDPEAPSRHEAHQPADPHGADSPDPPHDPQQPAEAEDPNAPGQQAEPEDAQDPAEAFPGPPMPVTARIVEQTDGVAVIEVTCSCGELIHVQCFVGRNVESSTPDGPKPQPTPPAEGLSNPPPPAETETQTPPSSAGPDEPQPDTATEDPFSFTPPEIEDEPEA